MSQPNRLLTLLLIVALLLSACQPIQPMTDEAATATSDRAASAP